MSELQTVAVTIMEREYAVSCPPEQRAGLIEAAAYLDGKMREVRNAARSATADRVAVLAALNVVHELLELKRDSTQSDSAVGEELFTLRSRLDAVLGGLLPR